MLLLLILWYLLQPLHHFEALVYSRIIDRVVIVDRLFELLMNFGEARNTLDFNPLAPIRIRLRAHRTTPFSCDVQA